MAVLNPQVAPGQDKMPSFLKGYSEPISQPKADESGEYSGKATGIALATAGKAFEGIAELADSTVKGVIKNDVYSRVDPLTDGYIDALKELKANPTGLGPAAPATGTTEVASAGPVDIMANVNSPDVPPGLAAGLKNVERLGAAQASGKPSNTEIDMKLYAQLKDLRATYPGWREYVDATMQKATGKDIANELVNSLRTDIAQRAAKADKETTFWQHQIVSNSGFPGSKKALEQYNATGDSNKVMEWLAFNQGQLNALALKKAQFESQSQDEKTQITNATNYAVAAANHAATIAFANDQMLAAQGGVSAAKLSDQMYDLTVNQGKANDDVYRNLSQQYEAIKAKTYTQTAMLLNTRPKLADGTLGKSVADIIGPEETKKIINSSVGALFEKTSEFIKDKQFGPAYTLGEAAEATQRNATFKVLKDPTVGGRVQTASVFNKLIPQLAPDIVGSMLGAGLNTDVQPLIKEMGQQAIAQTGGYKGADGKTYTFSQSIDEMRQAGNISGTPLPGQAYKNLTGLTKVITDPTAAPEAKSNAIKYFYDPSNRDVLSKFMDDYYDDTKGRVVQGRSSAFATLTAPAVTQAIRAHAASVEPTAWPKYSNWAQGEAVGLIRNQVGTINELVKNSGGSYDLSWDSKHTRLMLRDKNGTDNPVTQNLNMVLGNLAEIAKVEGSNVDAFVFRTLKAANFSPTKDIEGVPAQIMRAMISSKGYKINEKGPANKFAAEPSNDVQSFIRNPTGSNAEPLESYQTRGVIKGNLSDEQITGIQTDEIPPGMSVKDFLRQLNSRK